MQQSRSHPKITGPIPYYRETLNNPLDETEIERLKIQLLHNDTFDLVRDGLLFQIYTGLGFTDMANAHSENLTIIDGMTCLRVSREKTKTPCLIPLLPPALALIEKYKNWPICKHYGKLIPTITNQRMNQRSQRNSGYVWDQ